MHLARFPRVRLCHCPTPLEPMPALTRALRGPTLYVKRDDCTGLATGGNKTRKLEFLIGDAIAQGADTVITHGAVQSNHVRQTAAAAAKMGLQCRALLEERVATDDPAYAVNGNVLLDRLLDSAIRFVPEGTDMDGAMEAEAADVRAADGTPYVIPGGGSSPVGALGYVNAALEIIHQANEARLRIDRIVCGSGSTGTHAGLVTGLHAMNGGIPVTGICVRRPDAGEQEALVHDLATRAAKMLGMANGVPRDAVTCDGRFVGPGYGLPTREMVEAVTLAARHEGLLLDPVYTGKTMAGLIALIREGAFAPDETILFMHTGGSAALFGYPELLSNV